MDILWTAVGIAVIVVFVFYVLAQHWQRLLRQQNWTIRRLFERVQSLEEMADPEWRRRLSDAVPVPLEQVFTLSFRLDDRFWHDAVRATEDDLKFIREYGSFVGAVKLERWRSHTVATITEVLPDRKATGWQTRALDFYPDPANSGDALSLWELALSRPGLSAERPPSLELLLRAEFARTPRPPHFRGAGPLRQRTCRRGGQRRCALFSRASGHRRARRIPQPRSGGLRGQRQRKCRRRRSGRQRKLLAGVLLPSQRRARHRMAAPPARSDAKIRVGALEDSGVRRHAARGERIIGSGCAQDDCGRTGRPTHTFSKPRISRTTANVSCVVRHQ